MSLSRNSCQNTYLGKPFSEQEWLKYLGICRIFAGLKYNEYDPETEGSDEYGYDDYWTMEDQESIKNKLIAELAAVGVKCQEINIVHQDYFTGLMHCECVCLYNKPYIVYESEFFLKGLSEFPTDNRAPLEFYFEKRIDT